ncbi:unnamed protein product [Spirodela intermedia]|uniref:EF-hand domain-containing protein n=1 Tax=Spirodela intermedia TaxID=51605 RepID=A0A7I8J0C0_SPIIN|nr:unnamed protein product [Spirodela intermedia]CAA6663587.1 unnamed protein product [Spirodela intermedia]
MAGYPTVPATRPTGRRRPTPTARHRRIPTRPFRRRTGGAAAVRAIRSWRRRTGAGEAGEGSRPSRRLPRRPAGGAAVRGGRGLPAGGANAGVHPVRSAGAVAVSPGTDPSLVACFQAADQDGSGLIDDKELQRALSSYNQSFSIRTVHLLMYLFTGTNVHKIGPKEFTSVFYSLQNWRAIFERFDRDRSGRIDANELRDALLSLGFSVSPIVLDLLVSKFDKTGGKNRAIEYDNFIECCLSVKGLTEKFKERDTSYSGMANFSYENFMLTVLPFLIA